MAVFYNSRSGLYEVASQSLNPVAEANFLGLEAQLHTGTGWHEYPSLAAMRAAVKANGWPAPKSGVNVKNLPSGVATGIGSTAGSWFNGLETSGGLLRIAEIALGIVLIAVGVARLTSAVPVATAVAKKVGAVGLAA